MTERESRAIGLRGYDEWKTTEPPDPCEMPLAPESWRELTDYLEEQPRKNEEEQDRQIDIEHTAWGVEVGLDRLTELRAKEQLKRLSVLIYSKLMSGYFDG